jgi:hypothetical protein
MVGTWQAKNTSIPFEDEMNGCCAEAERRCLNSEIHPVDTSRLHDYSWNSRAREKTAQKPAGHRDEMLKTLARVFGRPHLACALDPTRRPSESVS